ncbi:HDOD domain-containing protein [Aquincola sp. S2]|uniref:HDOD domain-containing protein n=1 Tax=Pseudaquabacterium terrae TaxID=2732868 RepID=A0ABX2EAJ9_9BURK|nr:HDOD domain-containing protein [Aquabacterium terrae]NRF66110.1 HDOD domain-containing protein [Aquabacterium terrae]
MPPAPPFLSNAPADVAAWIACFQQRETPVFASTARAIADLGANEDAVDANMLSEALSNDPLMVLKLLRHVAERRSARAVTDVETVTAAIVLMGIPPFFRAFSDQPTVEDRLASDPLALEGLQTVLLRANRAAQFALGFAVHRLDHDAAVIHEAALLHDFAEMLLWVHAPALARNIALRQRAEPTLRSADVQRQLLNVTLSDLQQALMKAWRLPELLVRISDDQASTSPQVRNVQLAIRVARHSARGWDNPALPDDIADIAQLLNMSHDPTLQLLHEIDS